MERIMATQTRHKETNIETAENRASKLLAVSTGSIILGSFSKREETSTNNKAKIAMKINLSHVFLLRVTNVVGVERERLERASIICLA